MSIVNKPVTPFEQPPYRGKLVEGGELRCPDDWHRVMVHIQGNGKHLICHDQSCMDEVVLEIHDSREKGGNADELENCRMESFALTSVQRMELAIYLLSTVNYR